MAKVKTNTQVNAQVSEHVSIEQLDGLLNYLKKTHPLPKTSKLLVMFDEVASVSIGVPGFPFSETSAMYYPNFPTKKLPYTGLITVARLSKDPLNSLAHEYRHALQHGEGVWCEDRRWEMESDAIQFARQIIPQYKASCFYVARKEVVTA